MKDKAYEINEDRNYYSYKRALSSMFYKFFNKKTGLGTGVNEHLDE